MRMNKNTRLALYENAETGDINLLSSLTCSGQVAEVGRWSETMQNYMYVQLKVCR